MDSTPYDPTDAALIDASKKQMSQGGRSFSYVPGAAVIRQLCKVFPLGWRFEYDEPKFIPNVNASTGEALLTGTWRCDGRLIITASAVSRALGSVPYDPKKPLPLTISPASEDLVLRDIGFCAMPNTAMIETAMKGAFTDALKRCARQLGDQFGNSLYDGGEKDEDAPEPKLYAPKEHPLSYNAPAAGRPNVPAHFRDDDDMPPDPSDMPPAPRPITCRYDAVILSEAEVKWCEDKRRMANGQVDYACRSCQMKQKDMGLGIGA